MRKYIIAVLLSSTMLPASALAASPEEMEARIKSLEAKLSKFEKVMDDVDGYIEAEVDRRIHASSDEIVSQKVDDIVSQRISEISPAAGDTSTSLKLGPGPRISTPDGSFSFAVSGKLQTEASFYDDDKTDHPDGTNVRRARLGVSGKMFDDWQYKLEADFAKDATAITDAWIQYNGLEHVDLRVGQFREFLGMDVMTPNTYTLMLERAAPVNAFAISNYRHIGVAALGSGSNWSASAGLFGERLNKSSADDEGHGASARITYAPINDADKTLHFGIAGQYREPDSATDSVTFRDKAGNNIQSLQSVSVTVPNTDYYTVLGLEAAGNYGPFYAQAEYLDANVNVDTGSDGSFDGYYVQGSWMITGEAKSYSAKNGSYGRVKPDDPFSLTDGGFGAWEIGAHYSNTDLNDGAAYTGGEMDIIGGVINWYPNSNVRISGNYISADTDSNAVTADDDPEIVTLRAQLDF